MNGVVGIDTSLDFRATVPGTTLSVWDDAVAWLGASPQWVSRPMGDGGGAATPLTAAEVAFLLGKGAAILPYYNNSRLDGTSPPPATYQQGVVEAEEAIAQANGLGVPDGVYLACDIESTAPVTPDWVRGWCDTIRSSRFAGSGMIYGIITPGSPLANAIGTALANDPNGNVRRLYLWSANWTVGTGGSTAAGAPAWNPGAGSLGGQARVWQFSGGDFNDITDLDEIDPALLTPGGGLWEAPKASEPPPVPVAASTAPPPPITPAPPVPPTSVAPTSDRDALVQIAAIANARLSQN